MGGRDVTRSLGAEDRRRVVVVVVATVDIESRMVADHRKAYPGVCVRAGMRAEDGCGWDERSKLLEKGERCGTSKNP
jgi:hypothetical protein